MSEFMKLILWRNNLNTNQNQRNTRVFNKSERTNVILSQEAKPNGKPNEKVPEKVPEKATEKATEKVPEKRPKKRPKKPKKKPTKKRMNVRT